MKKTKTITKTAEDITEFNRWLKVLAKYHKNRFQNNYKQYTTYAVTEGTESTISDPVAPELIERVVQKFFERKPKFFVYGRGVNLPKEMTDIISGIAEYIWENPDTVQASGIMRSKLKVIGREFCIIGNACVETYYNAKKDLPDFRIIPIEDVIFDPTKTLKTSGKYYVRSFVSLDYLKEQAEVKKGDKIYGVFKNIPELEKLLKDIVNEKDADMSSKINRSGSDLYEHKLDKIQIITKYEHEKVKRFVKDLGQDNEESITIQEYSNKVLNDDPLDFVMDIEVPNEPYAFSILDFLNGPLKAKDLFLNQLIDYGSKTLNPPLFADISSMGPLDKPKLANAWKIGGLVPLAPQLAEHKTMPPLGNFGFDMLNYLQQRSESSVGIGAYMGGVPNQPNDKTQGTKGGIEALINQAQSPLRDRQQNIEESIIEPFINKAMKIYGALMGTNDIKDILITGQEPKWIKATKGLLTGKITIYDLLTAELMTQDEVMQTESMQMANGLNPKKEIVIDTDWVIRCEAGSMAEVDTEKELNNFERWVNFNMTIQRPLDMDKISKEMAFKIGVKNPEQYDQAPQPPQPGMPGQPGGQPPMIGSTPVDMGQGQPQGQPNQPTPQLPPQGMPAGQLMGQGLPQMNS